MLENAPAWIEMMSLENHLGEVIHSMNGLLDWLNKVTDSYLPLYVKNLIIPPPPSLGLKDKVTTLHIFAMDCVRELPPPTPREAYLPQRLGRTHKREASELRLT